MLWGAFGVTLFGIFLTPVFFYVIRRLVQVQRPAPEPDGVGADRWFRGHSVAMAGVSASDDGEPGRPNGQGRRLPNRP